MQRRVTLHWTGGGLNPNETDISKYHFLVDGLGKRHNGLHQVSDNNPPLRRGAYAGHVEKANSYNIGVAMCGMFGATWSEAMKGNYGSYPITHDCLLATIQLLADLCRQYNIPVTKKRLLGHEEWDSIMGRPQARWDVCCIPSLDLRPIKHSVGSYGAMNYIRQEVGKLVFPITFVQPLRGMDAFWAKWAFKKLYGMEKKLSQDTMEALNELRRRGEFDKV